MFTGIIAGVCPVKSLKSSASGLSLELELEAKLALGLVPGASVAVNGVCLTAVSIDNQSNNNCRIKFDVVNESLNRSNLSEVTEGSLLNVERSLKFGDEVGGHLCSGHVDTTVTVLAISLGAEIDFEVAPEFYKFIFEKGYVALNGASLTIAKKLPSGFRVAFIPETLARTNLGKLIVGSNVNLEIDRTTQAIVETVERMQGGNS